MDLNQLRYFVTVAEKESVTRAAQELYLSQSALSRAITRFEGELGVQLFDRNGKTLQLSEKGREFLPYAYTALNAINAGVRSITQDTLNHRVVVANYAFLGAFDAFCEQCSIQFPNIDLVTYDDSRAPAELSAEDVPDLLLVPEKNYRGCVVVRTFLENWCVVYSRGYAFRSDCNGRDITPRQLAQEHIAFDNSPFSHGILEQVFPELPEQLSLDSRSSRARIAVNRGQAVGIIPVAAFMHLKQMDSALPIEGMLLSGKPIARKVYLSHRPDFLKYSDHYGMLRLLDANISAGVERTKQFMDNYF